jgi:hypothetical protein
MLMEKKLVLRNRAFQIKTPGTTDALEAWAALNSASRISVVKSSTPVSAGLPNSLSLAVPAGTTGTVGFSNAGYWGERFQYSKYCKFDVRSIYKALMSSHPGNTLECYTIGSRLHHRPQFQAHSLLRFNHRLAPSWD